MLSAVEITLRSERLLLVVFLDRDGDLLDLVDSELGGSAEGPDDGLGVETVLHVRLKLLQELSSQESDGGGAVPDLRMVKHRRL